MMITTRAVRAGLLWLLGSLLVKISSAEVFLGTITGRAYNVAGEVYLLTDRILEVRGYTYDGRGPAAYFWFDTSPTPTGDGIVAADGSPSSGCATNPSGPKLPFAGGTIQRVELPPGTTINDFLGGSFSVWCELAGANFGHMVIPTSIDIPTKELDFECFANAPSNEPIFLSSFTTRSHLTAGDLYVVSPRVLEIRNFVYDGEGPAAYFWMDKSAAPSRNGFVVPDASPLLGCAMDSDGTVLGEGNGGTQYVELPPGMTVADFAGGSLSVWCEAVGVSFGHAVIPADIVIPDNEDVLECFDESGPAPIAVTPEGYNCEPMNDQYQVRWQIDGDFMNVELVGRIPDAHYMGFGISGRPQTETWMVGADAVVADITESGERVRDTFMNARSQCANGNGVCPDTEGGFSNDVSNVSSEQDFGLTLVRYRRPLVPAETGAVTSNGEAVDLSIPTTAGIDTYIVWAIGPISDVGNPLFHNIDYPRNDVSLDFGRAVADNCQPLAFTGGTSAPTMTPPPPFRRPLVGDSDGSTTFDCHIGPSGGPRGYSAITGAASWGIAWYVNDYLIPELTLRRGTTYTFRASGGDDPSNDASYHPFYLTDSEVGGYGQLTPEDRLKETVYAGVEITDSNSTGVYGFNSLYVAPICKYETTDTSSDNELGEYEDYFGSLDTSCARDPAIVNNAAEFTFTPDAWTPDTLYYHCVTHRFLGYKITVIDEDAPVATLAPTGAPGVGDEFTSVALEGGLSGATFSYAVTLADPAAGGADTMTVILEVPAAGWIAFAFNSGDGKMVGSEAVIGLPDTGEVQKYFLGGQSVAGVTPMPDARQTLINSSVEQTGSTTTLTFTKILVEEGEIPIVANGDNTFLSAFGSSNQLAFHAAREPFTVNLESGGAQSIANDNSAVWAAHGFLAAFAWAAFTPLAITASMVRKCFPEGLWFQIHRAFNVMTVLLTIAAFVIAVINVDSAHFSSQTVSKNHRPIGLVIFILAILQAAGGIFRPHLPEKPDEERPSDGPPEKSGARKGWEIGHRLFGLGIVALSWYQIQLGIKTYQTFWMNTDEEKIAALTAFWVIVASITLIAIIGFLATFNK